MKFDKIDRDNLISYSIKDNANGDEWKEIKFVFNGSEQPEEVKIAKGDWIVIARDGKINAEGWAASKAVRLPSNPHRPSFSQENNHRQA
ncbi:MAG: hypothetical protein ACI4AX_07815 [Muribaculaceae bacterium]